MERITQVEIRGGLFNSREWEAHAEKVSKILNDFLLWLRATKEAGGSVYGYGAAAKASTILNSVNVDNELISAIADASIEKQGRFMPPDGIRIISPITLFAKAPTDVVIFPWNIKSEIVAYLEENLGKHTRFWCAIPKLHEVTRL